MNRNLGKRSPELKIQRCMRSNVCLCKSLTPVIPISQVVSSAMKKDIWPRIAPREADQVRRIIILKSTLIMLPQA